MCGTLKKKKKKGIKDEKYCLRQLSLNPRHLETLITHICPNNTKMLGSGHGLYMYLQRRKHGYSNVALE
jgi:hypothetical protein